MIKEYTGVGGCAQTCCDTQKRVQKLRAKLCGVEKAIASNPTPEQINDFFFAGNDVPVDDSSSDDGERGSLSVCDNTKACFSSCGPRPTTCAMIKEYTDVGGCAQTCCETQKKVKKLKAKLCGVESEVGDDWWMPLNSKSSCSWLESACCSSCGRGGYPDLGCRSMGDSCPGASNEKAIASNPTPEEIRHFFLRGNDVPLDSSSDSSSDDGEQGGAGGCDNTKACFSSCGARPTTCAMIKEYTGVGGCAQTCCDTQKRVQKLRAKLCGVESEVGDDWWMPLNSGPSCGWLESACCSSCGHGGYLDLGCRSMGVQCPGASSEKAIASNPTAEQI